MDNDDAWVEQVKAGDFSTIPGSLKWKQALLFSQAIGNMYRHAGAVGLPNPKDLYEGRLEDAKRTGQWHGTTVELWVMLWYSYRVGMMALGLPAREDRPHLDRLCTQLRDQLQTVCANEKAVLMTLIRIAWTTECYPTSVKARA